MRFEILLNLMAALTMLVAVPLSLISHNASATDFVDYKAFFLVSLLLGSLVFGLSTIGSAALHRLGFRLISRYTSALFAMWIVVAGIFFPVSISTGMADPGSIPPNKLNFVLSLLIASLFSCLSLTEKKEWVTGFVAIAFCTTIIFSSVDLAFDDDSARPVDGDVQENHEAFVLSAEKNILVIGFDGLPGKAIDELLRTNVEIRRHFQGFKFFRNAVAQSPATRASLNRDLFGDLDYKELGATEKEVIETLKESRLYELHPLNTVRDSYQYFYMFGKSMPLRVISKSHTLVIFDYAFARVWTSIVLRKSGWERMTDRLAHEFAGTAKEGLHAEIDRSFGPRWDRKLARTKISFHEILERIQVGEKPLSLRYMHFTFTHYPVDFDEQCQFRSDDRIWHEANQNYEAILAEETCALNMFVSFLQRLHELGIYDNSLIVFKSDHGKPVTYFADYPDNQTINRHGLWGYNRYRPTLMIKNFGNSDSELVYEDRLVLSADLARTICDIVGHIDDCGIYPGINLLESVFDEDSPYYLNIVEGPHSNFRFDSHKTIKIPSRKVDLIDALLANQDVEIGPAPSQ